MVEREDHGRFDNNSWLTLATSAARSGPWGNGPLPNGTYTASRLVNTTEEGMVRNGIGFKVYLSDHTRLNRTSLRLHPDQEPQPGTAGCIGLNCDAATLNSIRSATSRYLNGGANRTFNVGVGIQGNPNYSGTTQQTRRQQNARMQHNTRRE